MQLSKVISTRIGAATSRLIKILRFGKSDWQEPRQAGPFGIDSNPTKGLLAVYSETSENGKPVILGYINIDQLADIGECRIYSTNESNSLKAYLWAKNDGNLLVNGNSDHMVRYTPLNDGYLQLRSDHNDLVNNFNELVVQFNTLGGSYAVHQHTSGGSGSPTSPGAPPTSFTPSVLVSLPSTATISDSKIDNVKTN